MGNLIFKKQINMQRYLQDDTTTTDDAAATDDTAAAATTWTWTAPTGAAWASWALYGSADCAAATADTATVANDGTVWTDAAWGVAATCAALGGTAVPATISHQTTAVAEGSVTMTLYLADITDAENPVCTDTTDAAADGENQVQQWVLTWTDRAAACQAGPPDGWGFGDGTNLVTAGAAGWEETAAATDDDATDDDTTTGAKALSFVAASALVVAATQF